MENGNGPFPIPPFPAFLEQKWTNGIHGPLFPLFPFPIFETEMEMEIMIIFHLFHFPFLKLAGPFFH